MRTFVLHTHGDGFAAINTENGSTRSLGAGQLFGWLTWLCHDDDNSIVYVSQTSPALINLIVCELLRNGCVETKTLRRGGFSTIVSVKRRFISLRAWLGESRVTVADLTNLTRDNLRELNRDFAEPADSVETTLLKTVRALDLMNIQGVTVGSVSMNHYMRDNGGFVSFQTHFPTIEREAQADLRNAYHGGFIWAKQLGEYGEAYSYDVNSLYPSIMRDSPLPYGEPLAYEGEYIPDRHYPLHVDLVTVRADLNSQGVPFLPSVAAVWGASNETHITSTGGFKTMWLDSVTFDAMRTQYDTYVFETVRGYKFRSSQGFFQSYIDDWYGKKFHADKGVRKVAKLMLNSLAGKFGTNPTQSRLVPQLVQDSVQWIPQKSDDNSPFSYLPVALFVTAHARARMVREIGNHYDSFLYCDTDSMILSEPATDLPLSDRLGEWKNDRTYRKLRILGMRKYAGILDDGTTYINLSGVPENEALRYDDFVSGATIIGGDGIPYVL